MNKIDAKIKFVRYLKTHNISYKEDIDNCYFRLTMLYKGYRNCPDEVLEACIWFHEFTMEARIYFDCNAAEWC